VLIHPLIGTTLRDKFLESVTTAHIIARGTSRAFSVLAEFALSDAVAWDSGPELQAPLREAIRDAIEVISAWRGPAVEHARPHLERMRELLDRSGLDDRLQPLAASAMEALGLPKERGRL